MKNSIPSHNNDLKICKKYYKFTKERTQNETQVGTDKPDLTKKITPHISLIF